MINESSLTPLRTVLDQAQSIIIAFGPKASKDQIASAIALYRSLRNQKGEVVLITPEEIDTTGLVATQDIGYKLGNKDLSISFDYDENAVDKVSYHIDEEKNKFYLIVKPKKGHRPLESERVTFDYTGAQADLIFLFGVHNYNSLDHLYETHADVYTNATVVTVHNFEPEIGDIKIDISGYSSWGEGMLNLLEKLNLEIDSDSATNLLTSIELNTNRLTSFSASAETFEAVAKLLRAGAKRSAGELLKNQANEKSIDLPLNSTSIKKQSNSKSQDVPVSAQKKQKDKNKTNLMRDKSFAPSDPNRLG